MKNLINCFVLIVSFSVCGQLYTRKDTLRFTADSSYSRIVVRYKPDVLLFGTSKTGVIAYNEENKVAEVFMPRDEDGEFRDLIIDDKGGVYALVSGKNGKLVRNVPQFRYPVPYDEGAFYDDVVRLKKGLIVLGDPIDGIFTLRYQRHTLGRKPVFEPHIPALKDEACYAGSGTTARMLGRTDYCFVSGGGNAARFHRFSLLDTMTYFFCNLPMATGEGAGPFSVFFSNNHNGAIVGGNYLHPNDTTGTAVYTIDGGKQWLPAQQQPGGYRCCVTGNRQLLFCAGTNGIDYSADGGKTWHFFDKGYFCALLLEKNTLYATSNKGYCIRYALDFPRH